MVRYSWNMTVRKTLLQWTCFSTGFWNRRLSFTIYKMFKMKTVYLTKEYKIVLEIIYFLILFHLQLSNCASYKERLKLWTSKLYGEETHWEAESHSNGQEIACLHENWRFSITFITAQYWTLSWATWNQSVPSHLISLRFTTLYPTIYTYVSQVISFLQPMRVLN
jgi:hypothetical protein